MNNIQQLGIDSGGHDVSRSLDYMETGWTDVYGIKIPFDKRDRAFLTSEPFMLAKMELDGIDREFEKITEKVYRVQKRRWQETGGLTAVTEDSVNQDPRSIYNCIFYDGRPWVCMDTRGNERPDLKNLLQRLRCLGLPYSQTIIRRSYATP